MIELNTKQQGNLGEIAAIKEFLKYGFKISLPYGDNSSYDFIIEDSFGKLYKIQVKSCATISENGVYRFSTTRKRINTSQNYSNTYQANEVDYFVLYGVETDDLFLLKYDEVGDHGVDIRMIPPKKRGGTPPKLKEDFLFHKKIQEYFN